MGIEFEHDKTNHHARRSVPLAVAAAIVAGLLAWIGLHGIFARQNFAAHNVKATKYYGKRNYPATIAEASKMIGIDPKRVDGYYMRGNANYMTIRYPEAIEDYTQAIALEKNTRIVADLYYCRGNCYYARHEFDPGIADATQAIRLNPKMAKVYEMRAWMYFAVKNYAAALADCNTTIKQELPGEEVYCLRGNIFAATGAKGKAEEDFKKSIALNPKYDNAYRGLADIYEADKSYGRALALYKQALSVDPGNANSWGFAGWDEYLAGDADAAIEDTKKAIALDGTLQAPRYKLGLFYAVKGDWAQARWNYRNALSTGTREDTDTALRDVRDAIKKQPRSATLKAAGRMLLTVSYWRAAHQRVRHRLWMPFTAY